MLPGVDLKVRADTAGGFSQVLVVKTRQAAADPRLTSLHLATVTKGVTITADDGGNLTAVDGAGEARFTAPTPWMWDSASAPGHPSDASGPGDGARQAEVGVDADASGVTLTPDRAMLTASDIVFPLYIDPSWHPTRVTNKTQAFAMVHSGHPDTAFYNTSSSPKGLGVGYQNFEPKTGIERAYYRLDTGNIWNKRIVGATLNLVETYSASWGCERHPVSVWHTGGIARSTTWRTRPSAQSRLATVQVEGANNPGCAGSRPVGVAVTSLIASAAQSRWRTVTIGLTGDEDNRTAFNGSR